MPRYNAAGICMYLGTASLAETTTEDIQRKKASAAAYSERFDKVLLESEQLSEEVVPFPGDVHGFRVNFLKNVPFLQVAAGQDLFVEETGSSLLDRIKKRVAAAQVKSLASSTPAMPHANGSRFPVFVDGTEPGRHVLPSPYLDKVFASWKPHRKEVIPRALSLHIVLSEKTFNACSFDRKAHQLMIDVFFNGILASSVLMHLRDITSGAKTMHQVYAGHRSGYLIERPWIVVPPDQTADGSPRCKQSSLSPEDRWQELCMALMDQANERGFDADGSRSPSADYLKSLANMAIPPDVRDMQKAGGKNFGVIDVVVTAGTGRKIAADYLSAPQRLSDARYSTRNPCGEVPVSCNRQDRSQSEAMLGGDRDAEGEIDLDFMHENLAASQLPPQAWTTDPALLLPQRPLTSQFPHQFGSFSDIGSASFSTLNTLHSADISHASHDPYGSITSMSNADSFLNRPFPPDIDPLQLSRQSYVNSSFISPSPAPHGYLAHSLENPYPDVYGTATPGTSCFSLPIGDRNDYQPLQNKQASGITPNLLNFPHLGPVCHPGPLPPVGLFKVSPPSRLNSKSRVDPDQPRSSWHLNRFVLKGKNGNHLVDHRWDCPQRIAIAKKNQEEPHGIKRKRRSCLSDKESSSDGEDDYVETAKPSSTLQRRSTRQMRATKPPLSRSDLRDAPDTIYVDNDKPAAAQAFDILASPPSSYIPGPALVYGPARLSPTQVRKESVLRHRSGQPAKAIPFEFDNPEELLRRNKKIARTTTSQSITAASADQSISTRSACEPRKSLRSLGVSTDTLVGDDSSSLSSAPHSPKQMQTSHQFPAQGLVQMDGVLDSPAITSRSARMTNAARKPRSKVVGEAASQQSSKPSRKPLPKSKSKSKASQKRSATSSFEYAQKVQKRDEMYKQDTLDNPSLNQDSVICFAESKKGAAPVLRQVKSEKQGVFAEDQVVVGMRFFVPG